MNPADSCVSRGHVSRRSVLQAGGVAALGAMAAPFVRAQDKSGAASIVVGAGEHRYEVQHDWGALPASIAYGNTHGVCEDRQGHIYVKHTVGAGSQSHDAIVVFDAEGKFVRSWGAEFQGGAHGLHHSVEGSDEFLYLCDFLHNVVVKSSLTGEVVWRLKAPQECGHYADPAEFKPTNVAVAPNGDLYVADGYGKGWIHQYDRKAQFIRSFGGPGDGPGQLNCPHGLMVDMRSATPRLLVADRGHRRLHYFTLAGEPLSVVTDELRSPCHFDARGGVLLVPDLEARVSLFDETDRLIAHLGDGDNFALRDKTRDAFVPGKFIAPHGAIFDHAGNIFVVEWVEVGRVTKLRRLAG